jgi:hypothetical protein
LIVLIGFVFFRAQSITQALGILHRILTTTSLGRTSIQNAIVLTTGDSSSLPVLAATMLLIVLMFGVEAMQEARLYCFKPLMEQSLKWQAAVVVVLFQAVILFGSLRASSFIYFQF